MRKTSIQSPKEYFLIKKIGSGSFAQVWLAKHKRSEKKIAIKIIPKEIIKDPQSRIRLNNEIRIHQKLQHQFIAPVFQVCEDQLNYFIVMEYLPNKRLFERIRNSPHGKLSENDAKHYFAQILAAFDYLHNEMHVAHRDIKIENIMLDANNNIRIIDFGFSSEFLEANNHKMFASIGTPKYVAPEMFDRLPYTEKVDMWAIGVILYIMLCGSYPFAGKTFLEQKHNVQNNEPVYPNHLSKSVISLISGLLKKNPEERLSCSQAINHPWIKNEMKKKKNIWFSDEEKITNSPRSIKKVLKDDNLFIEKFLQREIINLKMASENPDYEMIWKIEEELNEARKQKRVKVNPTTPRRGSISKYFNPQFLSGSEKKQGSAPLRNTHTENQHELSSEAVDI